MNRTGVIYGINGPVIYLKGNTGFKMSEMVYVGKEHSWRAAFAMVGVVMIISLINFAFRRKGRTIMG